MATKTKAKVITPVTPPAKTKKVIAVTPVSVKKVVVPEKIVTPLVKMTKPKKAPNPVDLMTLDELKARRIQIAEQFIATNMFWEIDKTGKYNSLLDKTDYQKVKDRIEKLTK